MFNGHSSQWSGSCPIHHPGQPTAPAPPTDIDRVHQLPSGPRPPCNTGYGHGRSEHATCDGCEWTASANGAHNQQTMAHSVQQQCPPPVLPHTPAALPPHFDEPMYSPVLWPHPRAPSYEPVLAQQPPAPPITRPMKIARVAVACDSCRSLRVKCDGQKPCKSCRERLTECIYRESHKEKSAVVKQFHKEMDGLRQTAKLTLQVVQNLTHQFEIWRTTVASVPRQTAPLGGHAVLDPYEESAGAVLSWPPVSERLRDIREAHDIHTPLNDGTRYKQQRGIPRWYCRCQTFTATSLEPNSAADFYPDAAWRYVASYEENIQSIYPLIRSTRLHNMVTGFLASISQNGRAQKRKRGPDVGEEALVTPPEPQLLPCIKSALVLMVLALGKICLHRRACGADLTETGGTGEILGSDYFREADGIFRALHEAPTLEHVWVRILGSLYYDQVGQPAESFHLVTNARRLLRDLLQPDLERFRHMRLRTCAGQRQSPGDPVRVADNEKVVAAWTCLLLETEIVTEWKRPPADASPMLSEQPLPCPDGIAWVAQGFRQSVVEAFALQIHLHVLVDQIRSSLTGDAKYPVIKACIDVVQSHTVPGPHDDPLFSRQLPANNVLAARKRATVHRAELIVYRRFIQRILVFNHEAKRQRSTEGASQGDMARLDELAKEADAVTVFTVEMARRGIHALVQSTSAFHGLPDQRFIVPNMYGTARTQWGNLLLLDAVQHDPVLCDFVDNDVVDDLFRKTVALLDRIAEPSSPLAEDLRILTLLHQSRLS